LKEFLDGYQKIVIMGIGNDMRGDDALGSILSRELSSLFIENKNITIFNGGTVPENFTGAIKKENPSHIILMDAVDMKENPGHLRLIAREEIAAYSISTHALPLSFLIKYLESTTAARLILIGIQPKETDLGQGVSKEVQTSINNVVSLFNQIMTIN
jgi:hydrogenase 3 maturation protease